MIFAALRFTGSSPLARGTPLPLRRRRFRPRLIPARAGNTAPPSRARSLPSAHPRSRGEHQVPSADYSLGDGSSPLARGTLANETENIRDRRLIPARAGNTPVGTAQPNLDKAHPRSRGEHDCTAYRVGFVTGSSPLARGTPWQSSSSRSASRLIPARAGNTHSRSRASRGHAAHPRSRGEHGVPGRSTRAEGGSSPLARGTQRKAIYAFVTARLIPARAGNTASPRPSPEGSTAHPRSRGEHGVDSWYAVGDTGSSPLARGTQLHRCEKPGRDRLIPARAGNTSTDD